MNKSVITVQIGNSDDKLTQSEWHDYVFDVADIIESLATEIHFYATSTGSARWQNACWVFATNNSVELEKRLSRTRKEFRQESIAITYGVTAFI